MQKLITAILLTVGVIHLLPAAGVLGSVRLEALYGLNITEPNWQILMRHRAVLFGLLALFLFYAAFQPRLQLLAISAGLISVTSFIALAWAVGNYNQSLQKVVLVDIVAAVLLFIAVIGYWINNR